jgi:hypothetical protein
VAGPERVEQRALVDERAAGDVAEEGARSHRGERIRVEDGFGLGGGRGACDDGVDAAEHVVELLRSDLLVDNGGAVETGSPPHRDHLHSQHPRALGDRSADRA